MKAILRIVPVIVLLAAASPGSAIVGYYNYNFSAGASIFNNNLLAPNNSINSVLSPPSSAQATLSLWNASSRQFVETAFWTGTLWLDSQNDLSNVQLLPGAGAKLWVSEMYTQTFVGEVVNRQGSLVNYDLDFGTATPPPPGVYCLGDKTPVGGPNAFWRAIGRAPQPGEQIIYSDGTTLTYGINWFDSTEVLQVGEAALFNIGPVDFVVPEPSTAALGLLGLTLLAARRRV